MSQDSRGNFGVEYLDQHWRVAGGETGVGGREWERGGEGEKERKDMLRAG